MAKSKQEMIKTREMNGKRNIFWLRVLIMSLIGFVLFNLAYSMTSTALVDVFHGSACNTSIASVKEAMLITSPINFCEATFPMYKNLMGGLISNGYVVGILILIGIVYSVGTGSQFKKYLCFRDTFIVAVVSSYVLSLGYFLTGGIGSGTSIIGFDLLLYLLLAFLFGAAKLLKEKGLAKLSLTRLYFAYVIPIILICFFMSVGYLAVQNPWSHIEGGALLLGFLLIKVVIQWRKGMKPDGNKR